MLIWFVFDSGKMINETKSRNSFKKATKILLIEHRL